MGGVEVLGGACLHSVSANAAVGEENPALQLLVFCCKWWGTSRGDGAAQESLNAELWADTGLRKGDTRQSGVTKG